MLGQMQDKPLLIASSASVRAAFAIALQKRGVRKGSMVATVATNTYRHRHFKSEDNILDAEGFFDTGDIATIDEDGYVMLVDRSKDVIKSGGEWISSIDLENTAVGCPGIAMAAVIALAHPKWQERPLLICVKKQGPKSTRRRCWHTSTARSPNGGRRTMSCSSSPCQ
jgi:acyl-CoA synthetase (AMP-forming)/AMP-acid ligase II